MGPAAVQPFPLFFLVNFLCKIMTVATATGEVLKLKPLRVRYCTNILYVPILHTILMTVSLYTVCTFYI
jgi:hypothetical protein